MLITFYGFILKDNFSQWKIANNYFEKAKQEKIRLVFSYGTPNGDRVRNEKSL